MTGGRGPLAVALAACAFVVARITAEPGRLTLRAAAAASAGQRVCNNMWPNWSPDGRRIVFASDRTGDPEIYVQTIGKHDPVRLTDAPGRDAHPAFSPDGSQIAFQSPRNGGGQTQLYIMRADGSAPRRITSDAGFAGMPVWSMDGRQLAYQHQPAPNARWRLMLIDAAPGATPRALTDGTADDQVINWAPDGTRFVYHSNRSGRNQLSLLSAAGATTPLVATTSEDRSAAWSPDGSQIAFMSERDGTPAAVYILRADGTGVRRLGAVRPGHGVPFFSPDGTRVVVTLPRPGGQEIWTVAVADGRTERVIACDRSAG